MIDIPGDGALTLVKDLRDPAETRHQHARAATRGSEVRVLRGAYVPRALWDASGGRERHLLRLDAFVRTRRSSVPLFSHWSAAVLHGLPLLGDPPEGIHIAVARSSTARSGRGVVRHSTEVSPEDVVEVEGMRCTSLARTVVDIAATAPTPDAVAMADHALRLRPLVPSASAFGRDELTEAWQRSLPFRGHRRALEAIRFADPRAESPLESLSRVTMRVLGAPPPVLQESFADRRGFIGRVDFWWPEHGVVGEADGDAKYLDPAMRGGRSAERVVLDEKRREDRLRELGLRVVRWGWDVARHPAALATALQSAALPLTTQHSAGD